MTPLVLLVVILLTLDVLVEGANQYTRAVPTLPTSEEDYHRYAAVLAATERAKEQCALEIRRSLNPLTLLYYKLVGTDLSYPGATAREKNRIFEAACSKYETKVGHILSAVGMNTDTFNSISQSISSNSKLKNAVMNQAFSYRLAADLENNIQRGKITNLPEHLSPTPSRIPFYAALRTAGKRISSLVTGRPATHHSLPMPVSEDDSKFTSFCKAVCNIEDLRDKSLFAVRETLRLEHLPDQLSSPELFTTLCKPLQAAVTRFPRQAEAVLGMHGLDKNEFSDMLRKCRQNLLFRRRVQREMSELQQLVDIDPVLQ